MKERGYPPSPPPKALPSYCSDLKMTDPSVLKNYLNTYMYVWLHTRQCFWFFPKRLDERWVAGYVWSFGEWVWKQFEIKWIDSFY